MTTLDRRLNAFRPDLADRRLEGAVEARRFVDGAPMRVAAPVADLLSAPDRTAGLDTQLLRGAVVVVFETRDGFAWVQAMADGYVGYVEATALAPPDEAPTHVVAVPRSFVYGEPDMKTPRHEVLSMGSAVAVAGEAETRGTRYLTLAGGGAMIAAHLKPLGETGGDYVAVAETLVHTPYLWGGASGFGLDCSGLVQLCLRMTGQRAPRDTDMQAASLGAAIEPGENNAALRRGDLVFWKGHVAIVTGPDAIIHANGHTMTVACESLSGAIRRIGYLYGMPTGFRRP